VAKPQRKRIGPYRLLHELGQGGMGIVWHAVHEVLQRDVAIKQLLARTAKDKEAVERFRREGLALAQLKHESIVGIHDLFVSRRPPHHGARVRGWRSAQRAHQGGAAPVGRGGHRGGEGGLGAGARPTIAGSSTAT
jgi:hypothetical protein